MTYEVDYIIKVMNAGAPQAIRDMANALNALGPSINVLDRLNKRIKTLNSSISSKKRKMTIDTTSAEKSLIALENHVNRIQQKLHLVSTYGGGKGSKGVTTGGSGRGSSAQPRDMWKHGGSLYARGGSAPRIPLPKGQQWKRGMIPYEALNARELQMWRQIENQQARLQKRMNQRASQAWRQAGGRSGTGMSKESYSRQFARNGGMAEYGLWQQGNRQMRNLRRGWVNSYSGPMSGGGSVPKAPIPMPFVGPKNSNVSSGGIGGSSRRGYGSSGPKNIAYKAFGPTPLTNNGGMAIDMLKGMGVAYGIAGVGQLMSNIINDAVEYENTMTMVENILKSNDNRNDFQGRFFRMQRTVRDVGLKTKYKVTEVADAARFLAMAGINVDDINNAINPIANLALVGDTDLAETADLVTNIMTGYNMSARHMKHAGDVMTKTFTSANVTLPEIAESLEYAGAPLSAGGIDFEEAVAAIGILGDAGLKGSKAGTIMRTLMSNVVNPRGKAKREKWDAIGVNRYDDAGNFKSLNDIFNELANKHLSVADFYQLFDKTAAQGAVALAMHVDKWNKVVADNFLSDGILEQNADPMKNTVKGLWAQLTSALSEDGLGGFASIQDNVKKILINITSYLNSDAGRGKVNEIFQSFWNFAGIIGNATKYLLGFFDKFSGIITFWMKVQLFMWPLIKTFTTLKSVLLGFTFLGQMIGKIGLLTMNLRSLMLTVGGWKGLGAIASSGLGYILTGGLMGSKVNLLKPGGTVSSSGVPNYSTTWGSTVSYSNGASGTVVYPNGVPTGEKAPKATKKFWKGHKKASFGTGMAGMLGMGLGAMAGDAIGGYFNGEGSSTLGSIVGGVAGTAIMTSAGSWLAGAAPALLTNPVGWGVLAVGALAGVGIALWKNYKHMKELNEKSVEWVQTMNNLYLDQIDWTKDNAIMVANMRLTTNGLMSQNDQLRAGINNWNKWWEAQNDPKGEKPADFKPTDTQFGIKFDELLDSADTSSGRNDRWRRVFRDTDRFNVLGNTFSVPGKEYTTNGKVSEEDGVRLAFMQMGAALGTDKNKKDYNPFYASATEVIPNKIWSSTNLGEWNNTLNTIIGRIVPEVNTAYDNIDLDTAQKIKDNILAIGSVSYYRDPTIQGIRDFAAQYSGLIAVLHGFETNHTADFSQMSKALYQMYDPYFSEAFGTFGTLEWQQHMVDYMHDANGLPIQQRAAEVLHLWDQLNNAFDLLPDSKKQLLAPYLQRDIWEAILPQDYQLPEGGLFKGNTTTQQYAYTTDNTKYQWNPNWTNAYGQQTGAWFKVNGDGTISTQPYFGTDLVGAIGTNTPRIPFSGTQFNPVGQIPDNGVFPYVWGANGLMRNAAWVPPTASGGVTAWNNWLPPLNNTWMPNSYSLPRLTPNVDAMAYKAPITIQTDKPVAQGNQILADNAIKIEHIDVHVQQVADVGTEVQNVLMNSWRSGTGFNIG